MEAREDRRYIHKETYSSAWTRSDKGGEVSETEGAVMSERTEFLKRDKERLDSLWKEKWPYGLYWYDKTWGTVGVINSRPTSRSTPIGTSYPITGVYQPSVKKFLTFEAMKEKVPTKLSEGFRRMVFRNPAFPNERWFWLATQMERKYSAPSEIFWVWVSRDEVERLGWIARTGLEGYYSLTPLGVSVAKEVGVLDEDYSA